MIKEWGVLASAGLTVRACGAERGGHVRAMFEKSRVRDRISSCSFLAWFG